MERKGLVLLVGSPRREGTSFSFARTLQEQAEKRGCPAQILRVMDYYDGRRPLGELKKALAESLALGLVTPMYVDSLPAPVIRLFELLISTCPAEIQGKSFFAISQCGFPDDSLLLPSLESCRLWSRAAGMNWLGGIGYGGGAIIDGTPLEDLGRKGRRLIGLFDLLIQDVLSGHSLRPEIQRRITHRIPRSALRPLAFFLNFRSRRAARRWGLNIVKGPIPF